MFRFSQFFHKSIPLKVTVAAYLSLLALLLAHPLEVAATDTSPTLQIVSKQYALGLDLLKLSSSEQNRILSPYSIHAGLTLARIGAAGATAAELDRLLFSESLTDKTLHTYASLHSTVASHETKGPATLANSLWIDTTNSFGSQFLRSAKDVFSADTHSIDFSKSTLAREKINRWVSERTNALIPNLLPQGMPQPDTSAALVNALYFKAPWDVPFPVKSTTDENFWLSEGDTTSIPMMHTKATLPYFENEWWQGVTLTYSQGAYSYVLLLPKKRSAVTSIAAELSQKLITETLTSARRARVTLSLPRYTIRHNQQLESDLRALGVKLALSQKADYSMMTKVPVTIGGIVHESVVRIDEIGTEAAAATAMVMTKTGLLIAEETKKVVADHPFAFALVHTTTQAPLFIGIVGKP